MTELAFSRPDERFLHVWPNDDGNSSDMRSSNSNEHNEYTPLLRNSITSMDEQPQLKSRARTMDAPSRVRTHSYKYSSITASINNVINNATISISMSIRQLQKSVGFLQGFSLIVGILIGSGVFISPSLVMADIDDAGWAFLIWITCGLIALGGSLCYCELGCSIQRAGGNYAYILEAYGSLPAFLCCWTVGFIVDPSATAAITLTLGTYVMKVFEPIIEPNPLYPKLIAVACIVIVAFINCWSVKAATRAQTLFTFAQIIAVVFIVVVGVWKLSTDGAAGAGSAGGHFQNMFNVSKLSNIGIVGSAMYNGLWAYDGWALVTNVTEEMVNLERNLLLSIITGIPFVIGCYILINISMLSALSPAQMGASKAVALSFIEKAIGPKTALFMPIFVAVSCYGAANGTIFAAARLSLAAGREGHLPEIYSMIHKTRHTPIPAVLMTSCLSLVMLIPDSSRLESLIGIFNFSCWFVYGITIFAVIVLRYKDPYRNRPYKVWLLTPIVMTFISICLVVIPFLKNPVLPLIGTVMICSGIPFYFVFVYFEASHPDSFVRCREMLTRGIKKTLNLAPCSSYEE